MNIKIGDILKYKSGEDKVKVLEVFTNTALVSASYDFEATANLYTFKEIEDRFEIPKEEWKPKLGEAYWFVGNLTAPVRAYSSIDSFGTERMAVHNCFKTEAEAEKACDAIKKLLKELK